MQAPNYQVPLARKLAFAFSWFGQTTCLAARGYYLMFFYTDVVLLGAGLAGLVYCSDSK